MMAATGVVISEARAVCASSCGGTKPPLHAGVTCTDQEPREAAGRDCHHVGPDLRPPKKVHDEKVELPEHLPGVTVKERVLIYDTQIDEKGTVTKVRPARPVPEEAPWPDIHKSATDAIRKWKYEPTVVKGQPVSVCMTVTVRIEVR